MTTHFYYLPNGSVYSFIVQPTTPVYNPYHGFAYYLDPYSPYTQSSPSTGAPPVVSSGVGFTDQGASEDATDEWQDKDDGYYTDSAQSQTLGGYYDYALSVHSSLNMTAVSEGQYGAESYMYPNPEVIRDQHMLHTLVPLIQPARLQNSTWGPTLDIVEEDTSHKFAQSVPKKMLVLFCGRKVVTRYLRTLECEDTDNEDEKDRSKKQELRIPRHHANHIGVKLMIAWMDKACRGRFNGAMHPIKVPKNLFAALSLSRTLTAFGLHRDANRVDTIIANHHYKRPLYPDEMVSIWNCLPKDSKYTYRMIQDLRKQRDEYEGGNKKAMPEAEKVFNFLETHPDLKARVDDQELNDSEQNRPYFGTEWCVRAALHTQQMLVNRTVNRSTEPRSERFNVPAAFDGEGQKGPGNAEQQVGQPRSDRGQQKRPLQTPKHAISLRDMQSKATPAAWPQLDKTLVLRITDAPEKAQEAGNNKGNSIQGGDNGW